MVNFSWNDPYTYLCLFRILSNYLIQARFVCLLRELSFTLGLHSGLRLTVLFRLFVRFALVISCILYVLLLSIVLSHCTVHQIIFDCFPYRVYLSYLYFVYNFLIFITLDDFTSSMLASLFDCHLHSYQFPH